MNKKLIVALTAPVFIFGCGQDKTAEEVLSSLHDKSTKKIVKVLEKHEKVLPTVYTQSMDLEVNVFNLDKIDPAVPVKEGKLSLAFNGGSDESNFETFKSFIDITAIGNGEGEMNGKLDGKASIKIVDNALFANLSEGKIESNQLPIAITAPSGITEKSYEISFADVEAKLNEMIPAEARGGKDIKVIDFIKYVSNTKAKEDIKLIAKLIKETSLFKVAAENPKEMAVLSEDKKSYIIPVELDKEGVEKFVNTYLDFVMGSSPIATPKAELDAIKEQVKAGLAEVKLEGSLTVDKSDMDDILFEGKLFIPGEEKPANIVVDTREDNLIISGLVDEEGGILFSLKDDKLEVAIDNGTEKSVVVKGDVEEKEGKIELFEPGTDVTLATISYKKVNKDSCSIVIESPENKVKVALEVSAKNLLSGGVKGSVEVDTNKFAEFNITSEMKKTASVTVEKPTVEATEKVDIEQAMMMLMMGAGGMMGGDAGGYPADMPPMEDIQIEEGVEAPVEVEEVPEA